MFSQEPDVFFLALPENINSISILPFESEWGITDELLCYYKNTLIGIVVTKASQPNFLGRNTKFINLLPKLDRKRKYEFPSVFEFLNAIKHLLSEVPIWYLRCEYDCDKYPIVKIQENLSETMKNLEVALLYSLGQAQECPTFCATYNQG